MNAAARMLCSVGRRAHVSDLLPNRLHWLGLPQRIQFKLCLLMYKALHGMALDYLRELCRSVSEDDARGSLSRRPHRPESGDKVRRQSIRHLRSSDVEQSAIDSQKFQHLVKLQICFEVSLVYLTIFSMLHQQLRSVTAPLNRFYVLWRHRNYRRIIIIIIFKNY